MNAGKNTIIQVIDAEDLEMLCTEWDKFTHLKTCKPQNLNPRNPVCLPASRR